MVHALKRIIFILPLLWGFSVSAECDIHRIQIEGPWGQAKFSVDVVHTPQTRAQGLMYRRHMPRDHGMLFVFQDVKPRSFWMKNTYIPLDILFFDADGQLLNIAYNARPHDLTSLPSKGAAQFVLEVNAGIAKRFRITPRTTKLKNYALYAKCFTN